MGLDINFNIAKRSRLEETEERLSELNEAINAEYRKPENEFSAERANELEKEYDEINPWKEVAYFRKVNFLLPFFGYEENCSDLEIDKCQVEDLIETCKAVLEDHSTDQIEIDYKSGLKTEQHLSRTMRKNLKKCTLSIISIENLGVLQETYGSTEVDKMIYNLVRSFRIFIRGTVYRNGSRFMVVSKHGCAEQIGSEIRSCFENYAKTAEDSSMPEPFHYIGATVVLPDDAETYDDGIEILKGLIEKAKRGKSCCVISCNEVFMNEFRRKKTIIKILDRELNAQSTQYQVYFQPIVSIEQNRFVYAEALSRLIGTELGDISPGEFIPIAENNGLIERLGCVNFEKVCEFISRNKEVVKAVSVNFSVYQMLNPNLKDFVFGTISKYGIKPENIIMEITESILIDDFEFVRERMEEFVKAGIVFYLDDFGTGFSNFANVIRLPFYTIKIDRSFVLMMEKNEEMLKLVKNLISTFKDSNLKILMEGVETEKQDELVKKAGVDYIQGFLYSKPLPMESYLSLLRGQHK